MSNGKDISFVSHVLAETLNADIDDLKYIVEARIMNQVTDIRRDPTRDTLVAAIGELEKTIQGALAKVQGMEAKVELAKCCL